MEGVTVLIPVGPNYNLEWLKEAVESVLSQTIRVRETVLIDDGAGLNQGLFLRDYGLVGPSGTKYNTYWYPESCDPMPPYVINIHTLPANVGFTAAFNIGMGVANSHLVVYLAADDKLMPEAVEKAVQTYEKNKYKDAWYAFSYVDSTNKEGNIPINAAMITKKLWGMVGGYPPAAFVGPDAAILSCLYAHAPDRIIKVEEGTPLYWIRDHDEQETKTHTARYSTEMTSIRNKITADFKLKDVQ